MEIQTNENQRELVQPHHPATPIDRPFPPVGATAPSQSGTAIADVPIASITVGKRKRQLDLAHVERLQDSIEQGCQITPIVITREHVLLAGAHRLEAMRLLGRVLICAQIVDAHGLFAELIEIDENLARSELNYLQRCMQTARRKQIYEELYPAAKQGGNPGLPGGGKAKTPTVVSFARDAASKTRQSESTVRALVQMGAKLESVAHLIEGTALADNRKALKFLADTRDDEREKAALVMVAQLDAPRPKRVKSSSAPSAHTEPSAIPAPTFRPPTAPTSDGQVTLAEDECRTAIGLVLVATTLLLSGAAVGGDARLLEKMRYWGDRLAKTAREIGPDLVQQDVCGCNGDKTCVMCGGTRLLPRAYAS